MALAATLLEPLRQVVQPHIDGWEHIPDERPLLFVGNHTLFAMLDIPFLFTALHHKAGIVLRPLGDRIHFGIPIWRDLLVRYGVVPGTPDHGSALMEEGECLLVFPGGAREAAKRRGESYQLIWKERFGFVRLALQYGCTIVPFSAVGIEHAFDIVADADDYLASPLGPVLRAIGVRPDLLMPIVRGWGGTPLPRPERLYFRFAPPIETRAHRGEQDDARRCRDIREQVRAAIEGGIADLIAYRGEDPLRTLDARLGRFADDGDEDAPAPGEGAPEPALSRASMPTPLGPMFLEASPEGLTRVGWCDGAGGDVNPGQRHLVDGRRWLDAYFEGATAPLPALDRSQLTSFAVQVTDALVGGTGFGEVTTYGALAERAGASGGSRAVGTAMAKNTWPLVVPCHRVVRADGQLGRYSGAGGTDTKRWLLAHEGRRFTEAGKLIC